MLFRILTIAIPFVWFGLLGGSLIATTAATLGLLLRHERAAPALRQRQGKTTEDRECTHHASIRSVAGSLTVNRLAPSR